MAGLNWTLRKASFDHSFVVCPTAFCQNRFARHTSTPVSCRDSHRVPTPAWQYATRNKIRMDDSTR